MNPSERVRAEKSFVDRPIKEVAKDFYVAVEGSLRELWFLLFPVAAEFTYERL
jgi:hypothetical protein